MHNTNYYNNYTVRSYLVPFPTQAAAPCKPESGACIAYQIKDVSHHAKKIVAILLIVLLAGATTACASDQDDDQDVEQFN